MHILRTASAIVAVCVSLTSPALAQEPQDQTPPAHLAAVEGTVSLLRENQSDDAVSGMPLIPGDRLRTDRGRAALLFPEGSALDLDEHTTLELLSPTLFRLTEGRVLLSVTGVTSPTPATGFAFDTPLASVHISSPGEYRLAILALPSGSQTELAVIRGTATLSAERGATRLSAGTRSLTAGDAAPSAAESFNVARVDPFTQWAAAQRDERVGTASAQYLPADLRMYEGTLDRNGRWQQEAPYGDVWYPDVADDWQPYDDGYWSAVPTYGWTWIGASAWSWPTHHYGRWGYARNHWFWIPDRRWAPAWVSWGAAPGYVSWCPLGYDNRPVFALRISSGRSWRGWTVLPRARFGARGVNVRRDSLPPRAFAANTPFVTQTAAPRLPQTAVRRIVGGAPATRGGTPSTLRGRAVPRNGVTTGRRSETDRRSPRASVAPSQPHNTPAGRLALPRGRREPAATPHAPGAPATARSPHPATPPRHTESTSPGGVAPATPAAPQHSPSTPSRIQPSRPQTPPPAPPAPPAQHPAPRTAPRHERAGASRPAPSHSAPHTTPAPSTGGRAHARRSR
jgi:hypothetical protein